MKSPVFLERQSYRRRRLSDMARLLPVLGLVLIMVPVMGVPEGDQPIAAFLVYIFLVWAGLILAAYLIAKRLYEPARARDVADPGATDGAPPDRDEGGA